MRGNRLGLFLLHDFIQTFTCSRYFVTLSEFILRKANVVLVPASDIRFASIGLDIFWESL